MKKLFFIFTVSLGILLNVCLAYANEVNSEYRSMSERIGERRTRQMMRKLAPDSKIITKDSFINRKLTRGERREVRQEKKKGIYKSPAEEFELMDKNKDGQVNPSEMNEYYIEKARKRYE